MKNRLTLLVGFILVTIIFGETAAGAAEPMRIRVGYPSPSASYSPLFTAKEAGLFRKNGLDVNLLLIPGRPTAQGIKALLDLAAKERPEAARVAPERVVNITLLKKLDDSGAIDRLYQ